MVCKNCEPSEGKLILLTKDLKRCAVCGDLLSTIPLQFNKRWDAYFHKVCQAIASKSPCLSRQIGAILVRDHSIISTGYNGPPRGIPHCGKDRFEKDKVIADLLTSSRNYKEVWGIREIHNTCPRRLLDFPSGTHMELCYAQHAEENAVSNAARNGVSTIGTILYMNSVIPCKNCFGTLINSGIVEIVVEDIKVFDKYTQFLIDNSDIQIRGFEL